MTDTVVVTEENPPENTSEIAVATTAIVAGAADANATNAQETAEEAVEIAEVAEEAAEFSTEIALQANETSQAAYSLGEQLVEGQNRMANAIVTLAETQGQILQQLASMQEKPEKKPDTKPKRTSKAHSFLYGKR